LLFQGLGLLEKRKNLGDLLVFLIDHLPQAAGGLHLVVASRMDPPWPRLCVLLLTTSIIARPCWFYSGDFEETFEVNHRSMRLVDHVSSGFFRLSACDEIWFNLARGNISLAAAKYKELDPLIGETDRKGRFLVTKASLLNALGQFSEVIAALEEPVREYDQRGEYWFLMNLCPLQELALHGLGREGEAIQVIGRCLALKPFAMQVS
jgi:hypothetical protein